MVAGMARLVPGGGGAGGAGRAQGGGVAGGAAAAVAGGGMPHLLHLHLNVLVQHQPVAEVRILRTATTVL